MRKNLSRLAAKGAVGFVVALALWLGLSAPYTRLLAVLSEGAIRAAELPAVTSITPEGTLMVVDRSDFRTPPGSMKLAVESRDVTFNFILLMTLFAASAETLSRRNAFGFLRAVASLVLVHAAAVIAFVENDYAMNFGAWSEAHYGAVARTFWGAAPYFYSVIGVHASAFALWWLFRPSPAPEASKSTDPARSRPLRPHRASARRRRPEPIA